MKKVSESNIRWMIAIMKSMANTHPISPFHQAAAHDMQEMLDELLAYRKIIDAHNLSSESKGLGDTNERSTT